MTRGGGSSERGEHGDLRDVTGELVSSSVGEARNVCFELIQRRTAAAVHVRAYRQSRDHLWWYRGGIHHAALRFNRRPIGGAVSEGYFTFFPAGVEVDGSYEVEPDCEYAVISFDRKLVVDSPGLRLGRALTAARQCALEAGVDWLSRELPVADDSFKLFLEGRGRQAIDEHIARNLGNKITLGGLAAIVNCSVRHFLRVFRQSTGASPMQYAQAHRIERAGRDLMEGRLGVGEIAERCGFGYVQHFAVAFKDATALTPGEYRRLCR